MTRNEILSAILAERTRQRQKWDQPGIAHKWGVGDCSSDQVPMIVKAAVLGEETGEVIQAILDAGPDDAHCDTAVRTEVIQAATVCWAILEGM